MTTELKLQYCLQFIDKLEKLVQKQFINNSELADMIWHVKADITD